MYHTLLILYIVSVVLRAAPYYNPVIVSERGRFGNAHVQVARYFEGIIKGILFRCCFIQWTTLLRGLLVIALRSVRNFMLNLSNGPLLIRTRARRAYRTGVQYGWV
jgi:hypothetical protein